MLCDYLCLSASLGLFQLWRWTWLPLAGHLSLPLLLSATTQPLHLPPFSAQVPLPQRGLTAILPHHLSWVPLLHAIMEFCLFLRAPISMYPCLCWVSSFCSPHMLSVYQSAGHSVSNSYGTDDKNNKGKH